MPLARYLVSALLLALIGTQETYAEPTEIDTDMLRASMVAYRELEISVIKAWEKVGRPPEKLAFLNEYSLSYIENAKTYEFTFLPKDPLIRGGGGRFVVSKNEFTVVERTFFK